MKFTSSLLFFLFLENLCKKMILFIDSEQETNSPYYQSLEILLTVMEPSQNNTVISILRDLNLKKDIIFLNNEIMIRFNFIFQIKIFMKW